MRIDIHTHAWRAKDIGGVIGRLQSFEGWGTQAAKHWYLLPPHTLPTIEHLEASRVANGFDVSNLLLVATRRNRVSDLNNWAEQNKQQYPNLTVFGALHPAMSQVDMKAEALRLRDKGFKGVKLHSFHQRFNPLSDDAVFLYALAAEHGLPILMDMGFYGEEHAELLTRADILPEIFKRVPAVTLIGAHRLGFRDRAHVVANLARLAELPNLYMDTSYLVADLAVDRERELINRILHGFPRERVLFGSDTPFSNPAREAALVEEIFPDAETRSLVFGGNAARILGLAAAPAERAEAPYELQSDLTRELEDLKQQARQLQIILNKLALVNSALTNDSQIDTWLSRAKQCQNLAQQVLGLQSDGELTIDLTTETNSNKKELLAQIRILHKLWMKTLGELAKIYPAAQAAYISAAAEKEDHLKK
jgi:predicted TIM-barrel fold metal-dependent hydrolase